MISGNIGYALFPTSISSFAAHKRAPIHDFICHACHMLGPKVTTLPANAYCTFWSSIVPNFYSSANSLTSMPENLQAIKFKQIFCAVASFKQREQVWTMQGKRQFFFLATCEKTKYTGMSCV